MEKDTIKLIFICYWYVVFILIMFSFMGTFPHQDLFKKKIKIQVVLLLACIDEGIMVLRKGGGAKAKRVNPSTPRSDQHVTSPCDVHMFSSKQLMRILKLIRKKF